MARKTAKKNPFEDLDTDYKTFVENATDDEIRRKASDVALAEHENITAKKADQDLRDKQEAVKYAAAGYTEATKANKLRIAYAYFILESRGKA